MHFVNYDGFVSKISPDTVKVDWNASVAIAIVFNPIHIAVQGVKALHQSARSGIFHVRAPAGFIDQLQFVDAESDEIGHIGRCRVTQARVELDALPFWGVVAGSRDDQTCDVIFGDHFRFIICQGWRGDITVANMQVETIGQAGFGCPTRDHV